MTKSAVEQMAKEAAAVAAAMRNINRAEELAERWSQSSGGEPVPSMLVAGVIIAFSAAHRLGCDLGMSTQDVMAAAMRDVVKLRGGDE